MITLTGQIDLNTEAAPDVALRQGDTMRQSEFEVKQDVNLENCSVDIFMVKPDQTFVIAACAITDNGKILITWPEQAAAVKGLGEYCIRISDNNSGYVFSARGRVWIDDHCVLDSMIESVAEANGYVFPDDFATLDDIPTVDTFIDDDVISNEKTWSSNKINNAISIIDDNNISNSKTWSSDKISKSHYDYSTTEKIVGTWIDGSNIYEKVYSGLSLTFAANVGWYNTHLPLGDIDILIEGRAIDDNNQGFSINLATMNSRTEIGVHICDVLTDRDITALIIRYTKTN